MRPLRIAFVTNEFITDLPNAGGLGNYLNRMSQTLLAEGHDVEIITLTDGWPRVRDHHGIRVESVRDGGWIPRRIERRLGQYMRRFRLWDFERALRGSHHLAGAFERRHAQRSFDVVQSTNCGLSGLAIPQIPGLRHLVRMSSARDLWLETDRKITPETKATYSIHCQLERQCMKQADVVYAPSQFLADYFRRMHGLRVGVLRPPACIEVEPAPRAPSGLPPRFLFHFGSLMRRKGTELVAEALPIAWRSEPELRMVWAGRETPPGNVARYREQWGSRADHVQWLGPLRKPDLYATLKQAVACVLPSLVDNLPNTVIESLLFSVPVIGSRGASIDELVEEGRSGELPPIGDADALANAMVRAWRGEPTWLGSGFRTPATLAAMEPATAARNWVQLALGAAREDVAREDIQRQGRAA